MRKGIIGMVAGLGLGSVALAADALDPVRVGFGLGLSLVPSVGTGLVAGASVNNLLELAPGVRVGARSELGLTLGNPAVGALSVAPVVTFAIPNGGIYAGPSLALGFGGSDASLGFGARAGIEYDLSEELMLYGFTGLNLTPSLTGNTAVGIDYEISQPVSGFAETRLVYGGGEVSWGINLGLNYRIR